jgi:hypothetical protein
MNVNWNTKSVFCHICNKDKGLYKEILVCDDEILCLDCLTGLGYTRDLKELFWPE